jgi:hypothetical protein
MADEATTWNDLHGWFDLSRIDRGKLYSDQAGVHTNGAEEFSSRMRALGSGIITTSLASMRSVMRRKARGVTIIVGWPTARWSGPSLCWRCRRRSRWLVRVLAASAESRRMTEIGKLKVPRRQSR